jgi:hypothetical protein
MRWTWITKEMSGRVKQRTGMLTIVPGFIVMGFLLSEGAVKGDVLGDKVILYLSLECSLSLSESSWTLTSLEAWAKQVGWNYNSRLKSLWVSRATPKR